MTALIRNIRGGKRRRPTPAGEPGNLDDVNLLDAEVDELDLSQVLRLIDAPAQGERQ